MADIEHVRLIERLAEEFGDKTEAQIYKNKKQKCSKCKYRGSLNGAGWSNIGMIYCNWAELTGHKFRDCLPDECKYFEKGRPKRMPTKQIKVSKKR